MNSNDPRSIDFSYKKYSLEQLDNWVNDALNSEDLTPQDIYDTVVRCVDESLEYHKKYLTKSTELLSLLKGHRSVDFSNEPYEGWDYTATGEKFPQYTEEELNAMCDAAAEQEEKDKCREYNLREAEYYNKRAELDAEYEKSKYYYEYDRNDLNRKNPFDYQNGVSYKEYTNAKVEANSSWNDGWTREYYQKIVDKYEGKKDKVKRWSLPVQQSNVDGVDDYYIEFPDDLLEAAKLKEGDQVEWISQGDGSYIIKKVPEKEKTYDEMIADGWTMTADGFWIRE